MTYIVFGCVKEDASCRGRSQHDYIPERRDEVKSNGRIVRMRVL